MINLPTQITLFRLCGLPFILYWLHNPTSYSRWLCLAVFLIAALTDWLDGYLARKLNQVSELGKFLDPLVDKLLVLGTLLALIELGQVPAWGVFLILGRELTIAGWRINPQLTGKRSIPGANIWGKLKTFTQITACALLIAPFTEIYPVGQTASLVAFWVAVALTLISGIIYLLPSISSSKEKSTSALSPPEAR